jgi:endonuclease/exonuclease/phosphatase family metal-dependent hydrolase
MHGLPAPLSDLQLVTRAAVCTSPNGLPVTPYRYQVEEHSPLEVERMKPALRLLVILGSLALCSFPARAQELKIISYNIHHGYDAGEKDQLANMARLIKDSGADLVGLQEVDSMCNRSGRVDEAQRLAELTGMHYAYVRHFEFDGGSYGLGILSRYPLSDIENHRLPYEGNGVPGDRVLLTARAALPNGKHVTMAVVHYSGKLRFEQSEATLQVVEKAEAPVILTGDLNEVPDSKVVENLTRYFKDTNISDVTTVADDNPKKKIDYVFVDKDHLADVLDEHVFDVYYSDHHPIMVRVRLKD